MRRIALHRRAVKYLRSMPRDRQIQIVQALEQIAALQNLGDHPNIKVLSGEFAGWFRLRTGVYRSIVQSRWEDTEEVLYVDSLDLVATPIEVIRRIAGLEVGWVKKPWKGCFFAGSTRALACNFQRPAGNRRLIQWTNSIVMCAVHAARARHGTREGACSPRRAYRVAMTSTVKPLR
jgi:mRNA-degrading endonuclease RelE of RelBE toxin-antitoxin system